MNKKIKLTTLILETKDGKKIKLSIDEAKELHEQLDVLFAKNTYIPQVPIIIESDRYVPPWKPTWYDTTGPSRFADLDTKFSIKSDSGLEVSYCSTDSTQKNENKT
jgi:hypothetical protein